MTDAAARQRGSVTHAIFRAGWMVILFAGLPFRAAARESDSVDRGREVYLAEGCINCHSQYIRPRVAADIERWGPASTLSDRLDAAPPMLGNRRQGPDLSNVSLRRSAVWNRLHLITPRAISPGSVMPAYAHLFVPGDSRGPDLLTYLSSLGTGMAVERFDFVSVWRPVGLNLQTVAPNEKLFLRLCANCHGPTGRGDGILARRLEPAPPDWNRGARRVAAPGEDPLLFLCRLIKFGLPGTAMAGHEYLPDDEVIGLARAVLGLQDRAATAGSR